jgi:hypothetical protein
MPTLQSFLRIYFKIVLSLKMEYQQGDDREQLTLPPANARFHRVHFTNFQFLNQLKNHPFIPNQNLTSNQILQILSVQFCLIKNEPKNKFATFRLYLDTRVFAYRQKLPLGMTRRGYLKKSYVES